MSSDGEGIFPPQSMETNVNDTVEKMSRLAKLETHTDIYTHDR
jgi:hypothetical protein